jgi:hypothetical protein
VTSFLAFLEGSVGMSITKRFLTKVSIDPSTGCWIWTGMKSPGGYGMFKIGSRTDGTRKNARAHRWFYEHINGLIPEGLEIDHLCHNRACVYTPHLEAVTHKENMRRGDLSGNGEHQRIKTHCPQGHEYNEANTHVRYNGRRQCRVCDRLRQAARRSRLNPR